MTFFCFAWHFLHKIIDKYRVFAYQTYIFPLYEAVFRLTEQAEKAGSAVYDQRSDLSTLDIHLKIIDKSDTTAVGGTYNFLPSEFLKSAGQATHLLLHNIHCKAKKYTHMKWV